MKESLLSKTANEDSVGGGIIDRERRTGESEALEALIKTRSSSSNRREMTDSIDRRSAHC